MKWNGVLSSSQTVNGGGPQGGTAGIIEYISQTNQNFDFLDHKDVFKFVDDASFLELLNLLTVGLASFNSRAQVPSDQVVDQFFIPPENIKSQESLNQISDWIQKSEMKLNPDKTKYMIFNFCRSAQFQTRLHLNNSMIEQVNQTRLLGVLISDDLTWHANTTCIVNKAYIRMTILRKLFEFKLSVKDLLQMYKLYIRSIVEQNCVVWGSSITHEESRKIERVQKIALRIIFRENYLCYENALEA